MFTRKIQDQLVAIVATILVSSIAVGSAVLPAVATASPAQAEIVTYA